MLSFRTADLCIEVKSQENLSFDGYRWRPETITRSPFKQAIDGRYAFHRRLAELAPQFRHLPVVHCCIFPRSWFDLPPNLSVQPWELMDMRAFRAFTRGDVFNSDLRTRIKPALRQMGGLKRSPHVLPRNQVDEIVQVLRLSRNEGVRTSGSRLSVARRNFYGYFGPSRSLCFSLVR